VRARCCDHVPASSVVVLPLDLEGGQAALEEAAAQADAAVGGAGVDYLVHNAGKCVCARAVCARVRVRWMVAVAASLWWCG
jgi:NAD(P)-dependent dehydrogenase (short-subunit alcohol dehydrogenase family)